MLRKSFALILTILYFFPAVGFSIDLHRCGKKVRMVSINTAHKLKCPCGTNMPFNCCKDVHLSVKIKDNQAASKPALAPKNFDFKTIQFFNLTTIGVPSTKVEVFDFTSYHAPPFKAKQPVYLSNSVFRI